MAGPRRNRSNKIPGVKLRPALPSAKPKRKDSGYEDSISDDDDFSSDLDTTFNGDLCPRPFKGVVLCATGINDKTTLFKQAIELGAQPISDLTDRVTHLIAEEPGSAKYKCALQTGITIMKPSWIHESHNIWLRGDDVDLQESIRIHKLPVFSNITISITGFNDISKRTEMHKLLTQNGGTYVKNIERPVKVTHLVCFNSIRGNSSEAAEYNNSTGEEVAELRATSDKLKYAEKFNLRKEADIQIVWEDWFWDCLASGGRWEENAYKVGLVTKAEGWKTSEGKSKAKASRMTSAVDTARSRISDSDVIPELDDSRQPSGPSIDLDVDSPAAPDEEEPASIKRVPGAKLALWESLLKPRGFVADQGKLIRSPSKSQATGNHTVGDQGNESPTKDKSQRMKSMREIASEASENSKIRGKTSLLANLQRSRSIAPRQQLDAGETSQRQVPPLKRVLTSNAFAQPRQLFSPHPDQHPDVPEPVASPSRSRGASMEIDAEVQPEAGPSNLNVLAARTGIFANMTFRLLGEARSANVKGVIEGAGGKVLRTHGEDGTGDDDEDVDIVLVRLVSGRTIFHSASMTIPPSKFRTECWLERCLFEERICAPEEHVSFRPLENREPIKGVESVIISHSGLDTSEACFLRRLARALGITIAPSFSRRSTHLICPARTGPKFDKAVEWGIPVIDMDWFEEMVKIGYVPGMEQIIDLAAVNSEKGKGKQRAMDTMSDITNNGPAIPARRSRSPAPMDVDSMPDSAVDEQFFFGQPHLLLDDPPSSPNHHSGSPPGTSPPSSRAPTAEPQSSQVLLQPIRPALHKQILTLARKHLLRDLHRVSSHCNMTRNILRYLLHVPLHP
ncbi:hypothetical protein QCA50_018437 [Cerrena zonata]|uniref:BRCT domain-containing protein n=1 Tax=Cerrena zonata TaxID=2478898 RepID=A0AAW0FPE2_9APHY